MKKMFLGLSSALLIVSSVMGMHHDGESQHGQHTNGVHPNVGRKRANSLLVTKHEQQLSGDRKERFGEIAHSFPSGTQILSQIQVGKITFEKVVTPSCLENTDELLTKLKLRLEKIRAIGMEDPKELFELIAQLTGDDGEREDIYGVVDSEIFDIDSLRDMILERLVESGCSDAISWLSAQFCSPYHEIRARCAGFLKYDGCDVSAKVLYVAGQYLDQLYGCKKHPSLFGNSHSILYKIRSKILQDKLPEEHFLSWALQKALTDAEALSVAP